MKARSDWDLSQYDNGMAFLDMLFNYLLAFATLFLIALLLAQPNKAADAAVKLRAEFVLTLTWPDGALDDIDLWLMLPDGRRVNFRNKDATIATLDRDDLGALNDIYTDADGKRQLTRINREMITIRAIVPGRYVAAAHVYAARPQLQDGGDPNLIWRGEPALPYPATLEVMKLNPHAETFIRASAQLREQAQEAPLAAFEVDADGNVSNIELNPAQYQIVELAPLAGLETMR